ncbi:hypothetical protein LEP1GSC132_1461 [Leptospira kirschneri str. 200803703]|nr:hypothetical protein LEP1GSC044_0169 [Leptospira kirschneri serovar Grippotyphosa str. RM52]EKQ85037.1 hypothetical protein LEP1GSC064_2773 [Leptospira kirschneri serovar Grippotyphosa str. Moskva]EKR08698.1 hypothetical protein LEP1GSC122_1563 [Leptospira kirschneri serovar Valbuzzi str. 200702274]EMJ95243.1 hypothetical protein LEP1GSC198_0600 [Leptospira kirschneri str. JB]EMK03749.1 hypothetical protein LEP1GSC176_1582 [Leptospira kirschneri str. MMD1493]EMK17382.1 hypothetical protein 
MFGPKQMVDSFPKISIEMENPHLKKLGFYNYRTKVLR